MTINTLNSKELSFETVKSFAMISSPVNLENSLIQEVQKAQWKKLTEGSGRVSLRGRGCSTEPSQNSNTGKVTGLNGLTFQGHKR